MSIDCQQSHIKKVLLMEQNSFFKKGILTYTYMTSTGETVILAPEDVLHIPRLGFDATKTGTRKYAFP